MKKKSKSIVCRKNKFYPNYITRRREKICKKLSSLPSSTEDLKYYKPAGLTHINHLSKILRRTIQVWAEERLIHTCGKNSDKPVINVEFKDNNQLRCGSDLETGHYTLKGGRDPPNNEALPNDCLYNVVSAQTGISPYKLRSQVHRSIRKSRQNYPFVKHPCTKVEDSLRGGARYSGKSKRIAKRVLDLSQSGLSHPDKEPGHPRGHASAGPKFKGPTESVENYSKSTTKTGFLSRGDQDVVAHLALRTIDVQEAMELMNYEAEKCRKEVIRVDPEKLAMLEDDLPEVQEWSNGKKVGSPGRIRKLVLVLKHFHEKFDDEYSDPFVLTFYPLL